MQQINQTDENAQTTIDNVHCANACLATNANKSIKPIKMRQHHRNKMQQINQTHQNETTTPPQTQTTIVQTKSTPATEFQQIHQTNQNATTPPQTQTTIAQKHARDKCDNSIQRINVRKQVCNKCCVARLDASGLNTIWFCRPTTPPCCQRGKVRNPICLVVLASFGTSQLEVKAQVFISSNPTKAICQENTSVQIIEPNQSH